MWGSKAILRDWEIKGPNEDHIKQTGRFIKKCTAFPVSSIQA